MKNRQPRWYMYLAECKKGYTILNYKMKINGYIKTKKKIIDNNSKFLECKDEVERFLKKVGN